MNSDDDAAEPATWANAVVGEAKQVLGRAVGAEELIDEGEDQVDVAIEVRERHENNQPDAL